MQEFVKPPLPERFQENQPLFDRPAFLWWALIGLIFAAGFAVRMFRLEDPPVDFHPTRQLHSALIARGMFYERNSCVEAWQREMAVSQWHMEGLIEPQVFERIVAWTYRLAGQPDLRIPRLYAIFFWMVGAVFVTLLAKKMVGKGGALVSALFFLLWPYGVVASRAFQPEPLVIAFMAAGLWAAVCWQRQVEEQQSRWGWTIAAGLLCGMAIFFKSVAVFFLAPALVVIVLSRRDPPRSAASEHGLSCPRQIWRDTQVWVLLGLAVLPYAIYHVDGVYLRGYLVGQFSQRFFPEMWLDPAFYLRWISNIRRVVPFEVALVAGLSAFLMRRPWQRAMLLAMWLGYFLYGMALPHHISTHDYYHLLLFPLLALGLGAAADALFQAARGPRWLARLAVTCALLAALVIGSYEARLVLKRSGAVDQAKTWEAVGQALGPGASVIALVDDYGTGLKYWAWINPALWPTAAEIQWQESTGQKFDFTIFFGDQVAGKDFFVVTLLDELALQPDLSELLSARYPVYRQGSGFLIYDLRSPR